MTLQNTNAQAPSAHRRIDTQQAAAGVSNGVPTLVTDGADASGWSVVTVRVYADQATAAGHTCSIIPWVYAHVEDDPAGALATESWEPLPVVSNISLDRSGPDGATFRIPTYGADRMYLQVLSVTGAVTFVNADLYGEVARNEVQAVDSAAATLMDLLRAIDARFTFTAAGMKVDTELTVDGNVIVDNLFAAATNVSDSSTAGFIKLNAQNQTESDVMRIGGQPVDLGAGTVGVGTQRTTQASNSPLVTRAGTNGAAASATGSDAAQQRYIAEAIDAANALLATIDADTGAIKTATELLDDAVGESGEPTGTKGLRVLGKAVDGLPAEVDDGDDAKIVTSLRERLRLEYEQIASRSLRVDQIARPPARVVMYKIPVAVGDNTSDDIYIDVEGLPTWVIGALFSGALGTGISWEGSTRNDGTHPSAFAAGDWYDLGTNWWSAATFNASDYFENQFRATYKWLHGTIDNTPGGAGAQTVTFYFSFLAE